ncbi:unnamed protein product [Linum trigynum]|uniref:Uncharacterized protein n=1 Tax=Linum trigynum TaxID=586398 RepID=A0AAV2FQY2_9ROSI
MENLCRESNLTLGKFRQLQFPIPTIRVNIFSFDRNLVPVKPQPFPLIRPPFPAHNAFHPSPPSSYGGVILASFGDYLCLWDLHDDNFVQPISVLNNSKTNELCTPHTSFDWNMKHALSLVN